MFLTCFNIFQSWTGLRRRWVIWISSWKKRRRSDITTTSRLWTTNRRYVCCIVHICSMEHNVVAMFHGTYRRCHFVLWNKNKWMENIKQETITSKMLLFFQRSIFWSFMFLIVSVEEKEYLTKQVMFHGTYRHCHFVLWNNKRWMEGSEQEAYHK